MNKSQCMSVYNKARSAAKRGITTKDGKPINPKTVNRALGVLQRKDQIWRTAYKPHFDPVRGWLCYCPSREPICKHIVAIMIEQRINGKPKLTQEFSLPTPETWYINSANEVMLAHMEGNKYQVHVFGEFIDKEEIIEYATKVSGEWMNLPEARGFRKRPDEVHSFL